MKALVVGGGVSGAAVCRYLARTGVEYVLYDDVKPSSVTRHEIEGEDYSCVFVSPGIARTHWIYSLEKDWTVTSEIETGLRMLRSVKVGVTGTNFKTTAVKMLEWMAREEGIQALALGNVGETVLDRIENPPEIAFIELSSYQLMQLKEPLLDYSVILNISENHIDWHGSFEEYARAKMHIVELTRNECFVSEEVFVRYGAGRPWHEEKSSLHPYLRQIFPLVDLLAPVLNLDVSRCKQALLRFPFLEHRLEKLDLPIPVYNDSKSTTPAATLFGIRHFENEVILIAGGRSKGFTFESWKEGFEGRVKRVVVFGENAREISGAVKKICPVDVCHNLSEAVKIAFRHAGETGKILFSPGSSSLDQFTNYIERGKMFKYEAERTYRQCGAPEYGGARPTHDIGTRY
ncbi:MAG: hypothetical protein A3F09_01110 [Chlamydiae bacterium RIFCSPHIGHO2_12_FULL_49_11]|nr:MAG: hypothetical protein A3F09_01110 [Chlamydiae bacterium RIFCSPHIGHO2_12_FULL_49_11]